MKRLSLYLFLILFTLPTPSQADDIRDFQIEGISVGDSLLDYFSKKRINERLKITKSTYTSKRILRAYFMLEKYETYPILNIHFKNDNKFTVESIAGFRKYNRNNIKDCYAEQREVLADLKNIFPNINQHGTVDKIHKYKKAGKGTYTRVGFKLPSGNIRTECRKWGKTIKYASGLNIILSTNSYMDWLRNEAYK